MQLMPIERIPDWEQRIARHDACWHGEIIDRPVVMMTPLGRTPNIPTEPEIVARPARRLADTEYHGGKLAAAMNTEY